MFTALCIKKTEVRCPCHKSLKLVLISWHVNPLQNAILHVRNKYRGADKSLVRPGRKQANISVRMGWICFGALPCRKRNLMTARISILLKSRASLTCFRGYFLPGRTKDFSAPRYFIVVLPSRTKGLMSTVSFGQSSITLYDLIPLPWKMNVHPVLGALAKLRKATSSFVTPVRLSVRPSVRMEQLGSQWKDFH